MTRAKKVCRRFALGALDAAFGCAVTLSMLIGLAEPAYAYVDPSVMTYTIQALAGVAVALSAVLGVVWRRVRRHALRLLRIDENAGKIVEEDVRATTDAAVLAAADNAAREERAQQGRERPEQLTWTARFVFALIASATLSFTVWAVAPLEIVAASSDSLFFGIANILAPVALFAAGFALALAGALSALRGRAYNVALALVFACALGAYVQAMALNAGLPPADGTPVVWDDYTKVTLLSAGVWIAIAAACAGISMKKPLAFKGAMTVGALAIVLAQSIGLATLLSTARADGSSVMGGKASVTMRGMMDVSDKGNIVLFVLDTFDTEYMNSLLASYPGILDEFTGFTYYPDSVGSMIPTRYAMASLITGRTLRPEDPAFSNTLIRSWYDEENILDDLNGAGFDVGVYSPDTTNGTGALARKTINTHPVEFTGDFLPAIRILGTCALYRDLPWLLKPAFWFYTDQINQAIMPTHAEDDLDNTAYILDDAAYYQRLQENGLRVDDRAAAGSFKIIHLEGAHAPYVLDEDARRVAEDETSFEQQCRGSLKIVSEYLRQLKQLGVYDNTTFILTADHGNWYLAEDIDHPTSPFLLAKPAGADTTAPCAISQAPTGHMDIWPSIAAAAGLDAAAWDGVPIWEAGDSPRERHYQSTTVVYNDGWDYTLIKDWRIDGDVLDFGNWSKTGREWEIVSD